MHLPRGLQLLVHALCRRDVVFIAGSRSHWAQPASTRCEIPSGRGQTLPLWHLNPPCWKQVTVRISCR